MTDDLIPFGVVKAAWVKYEEWTAEKSCLACATSPDGGVTCSPGVWCIKHVHWTKMSFPVFLDHVMRRKKWEEEVSQKIMCGQR